MLILTLPASGRIQGIAGNLSRFRQDSSQQHPPHEVRLQITDILVCVSVGAQNDRQFSHTGNAVEKILIRRD